MSRCSPLCSLLLLILPLLPPLLAPSSSTTTLFLIYLRKKILFFSGLFLFPFLLLLLSLPSAFTRSLIASGFNGFRDVVGSGGGGANSFIKIERHVRTLLLTAAPRRGDRQKIEGRGGGGREREDRGKGEGKEVKGWLAMPLLLLLHLSRSSSSSHCTSSFGSCFWCPPPSYNLRTSLPLSSPLVFLISAYFLHRADFQRRR